MIMNNSFIGYHYDIARGAYLKPDYFKEAIRLAAASGFTHFLPYLENMIQLPSIKNACPQCAYTENDWREFETVADKAGIELVPHFNVIGHTGHIGSVYPELAGQDGEQEIDVTIELTRQWTLRCLEEFCEFSTAKYFLIGGDEWQPPKHLLAKQEFNVARAWVGQVNLATDYLIAKGRMPIVWHDMLLHYPEALERLSLKAVIAFWFYDEDSDYLVLDMFKQLGFRTIMASGMCSDLSRRRVRAIQCAINAAQKYGADGFLMTSWGDCRWEKQKLNIPFIGNLIRSEELPDAIIEAISLLESLLKAPADATFTKRWKVTLDRLLQDKAWTEFPEYHSYLSAVLRGDTEKEAESYKQFHYVESPLFKKISQQIKRKPTSVGNKANALVTPKPFCLMVEEREKEGPVLRLFNKGETFVIYPKYGGSLQDWRLDESPIIPHLLPGFLEKHDFLPGGYGSYTRVGGFRPIWALGTHHNPCIIWQYPFLWAVHEDTPEKIVIELKREFYHVVISYRISIEKGKSGFSYEARAKNKLNMVYGAFNFHVWLVSSSSDILQTSFVWQEHGQKKQLTIGEQHDSFFRIPANDSITVNKMDWSMKIVSEPDKTAGYFIDWSTTFLTPDIHGIYRKLSAGDEVKTRWVFSVNRNLTEPMVSGPPAFEDKALA